MANTDLKELSKEQLEGKKKGLKVLIGVFISLIIGLFFFIIRDYLDGEGIDWAIFTIAICTVSGPVSLYPQLRDVQEELEARG